MFPGDYSRHRIEMDGNRRVFVGGLWGFDSAESALEEDDDEEHPAPLGHAALKFMSVDDRDDDAVLNFIGDETASCFVVGSLDLCAGDSGDSHNFVEERVFANANAALRYLRANAAEAIAAVFFDEVAKKAGAFVPKQSKRAKTGPRAKAAAAKPRSKIAAAKKPARKIAKKTSGASGSKQNSRTSKRASTRSRTR